MKLHINILLILSLLLLLGAGRKRLEIPISHQGGQIIEHCGYVLSYIEDHEQAEWAAYELTSKELKGKEKRTDDFRPDPAIKTGSAEPSDYMASGYDLGHLVPAADMKWSKEAMSETFFLSNMSPQEPGFNRGIWKRLEDAVRKWAKADKRLYVATGPVLQKGLPAIGPNKVSVPKLYYKVILDYVRPEIKAIGFVMPNKPSKAGVMEYAVTVDSVEALTGIDFFPALPDSVEKAVEKAADRERWPGVR